jgi:hypothetical protein
MSALVRNLIFLATAVAFVLGAVRAVAALPETMRHAGVIAPHTWEEVIYDSLQAVSQ